MSDFHEALYRHAMQGRRRTAPGRPGTPPGASLTDEDITMAMATTETTTPTVREYTNLEKALYSKSFASDLSRWLGSEEAGASLVAEILNQARRVPELHRCTVESIRLNVAKVAALRLDPALPNMVALIPRQHELTLQLGFAGLRTLAMRHPEVRDCFTREVRANDMFEHPLDQLSLPLHRLQGRFQPRGPVEGYYAAVQLSNGAWRYWPMSTAEIEAHVKRYVPNPGPAWSKGKRPEDSDKGLSSWDKQAMKTCLRMLLNGRDVPMTAEVAQLLHEETEAEAERAPTAAALQGYDRQGHRPALTVETGKDLALLSNELFGTEDHVVVDAQVRAETGQTAASTTVTPHGTHAAWRTAMGDLLATFKTRATEDTVAVAETLASATAHGLGLLKDPETSLAVGEAYLEVLRDLGTHVTVQPRLM